MNCITLMRFPLFFISLLISRKSGMALIPYMAATAGRYAAEKHEATAAAVTAALHAAVAVARVMTGAPLR